MRSNICNRDYPISCFLCAMLPDSRWYAIWWRRICLLRRQISVQQQPFANIRWTGTIYAISADGINYDTSVDENFMLGRIHAQRGLFCVGVSVSVFCSKEGVVCKEDASVSLKGRCSWYLALQIAFYVTSYNRIDLTLLIMLSDKHQLPIGRNAICILACP